MKKLSREERKRWIEKGKTLVIVFLCLCCVYLLWSVIDLFEGQISIDTFFWGSENSGIAGEGQSNSSKNVLHTYWQLSEPELVLVKAEDGWYKMQSEDENYARIVENINMVIRDVYSCQPADISGSDEQQWLEAMEKESVYAGFACSFISTFDAQFYEVSNSSFEKMMPSYSEVLFVPDAAADSGVEVYAKDAESGKIVKVRLDSGTEALKHAVSAENGKEKADIVFVPANDLGCGIPFEPERLVPGEGQMLNNIKIRLPKNYESGTEFAQSNEFTNGLINVFGYNPNTVRQYANSNGEIIFVGETGNLSLHPDGKIEYKALGKTEGLSLSSSTQNKALAYSVISGLSDIIDRVSVICGTDGEKQDARLKITAFPEESGEMKNRIEMDYFVDGLRVKLEDGAAVSAVVENGMLVELKMWVKTIEKTDDAVECKSVPEAVSEFREKNPDASVITWCKPVYFYDAKQEETPAILEIRGE